MELTKKYEKIKQINNFKFIEIVQDHEIGDAWLWILNN